jgi:CheY-like chemotaxis protein
MATRHIPVYIITTDDDAERGLRLGARMVITKPLATGEALENAVAAIKRDTDEAVRELLIVEPGAARREQLAALLGGPDVGIEVAGTGAEAIAALEQKVPACVVLNPHLPDMTAPDFAKRLLKHAPARAVSLLLHGDPSGEEQVEAVKRTLLGWTVKDVRTDQRLLDQTALYLHRRFGDLSPAQRRILSDLHGGSRALDGKKALIVDDDIRNIFALTSVLEEHHMLVVSAENGRDAIKALQAYTDIDVVLMDIMMPEMDGMETTRQIRLDPRSKNVPIIAVTAKAMKGDREKCIEAGAWDYLAKPVDPEELVAMLRAWLVR